MSVKWWKGCKFYQNLIKSSEKNGKLKNREENLSSNFFEKEVPIAKNVWNWIKVIFEAVAFWKLNEK